MSPYSYVSASKLSYLVRPDCLDEPLRDGLLLDIATGSRVFGELLLVSLLLGNIGHGYDFRAFEGYDGEVFGGVELEQKGKSGRWLNFWYRPVWPYISSRQPRPREAGGVLGSCTTAFRMAFSCRTRGSATTTPILRKLWR